MAEPRTTATTGLHQSPQVAPVVALTRYRPKPPAAPTSIPTTYFMPFPHVPLVSSLYDAPPRAVSSTRPSAVARRAVRASGQRRNSLVAALRPGYAQPAPVSPWSWRVPLDRQSGLSGLPEGPRSMLDENNGVGRDEKRCIAYRTSGESRLTTYRKGFIWRKTGIAAVFSI